MSRAYTSTCTIKCRKEGFQRAEGKSSGRMFIGRRFVFSTDLPSFHQSRYVGE